MDTYNWIYRRQLTFSNMPGKSQFTKQDDRLSVNLKKRDARQMLEMDNLDAALLLTTILRYKLPTQEKER
ncbi:unnamed protein product [Pieris macdunnoughi]|uniref:Uncharacterized protein n=1 Tax=Pieris macdunnoughi TaxID=345717 RepID=A0A821T6Y6_9NEOP|nr:unnamed protein product [Pieris macdunnoughi]